MGSWTDIFTNKLEVTSVRITSRECRGFLVLMSLLQER